MQKKRHILRKFQFHLADREMLRYYELHILDGTYTILHMHQESLEETGYNAPLGAGSNEA